MRLGQIELLIYFVFNILALTRLEILSEDHGMLDVRSFRYKLNCKEEQEILDSVTHFNSDHTT